MNYIKLFVAASLVVSFTGITFSGPTAKITLDEVNTVNMLCTKAGWLIHHID